MSEKNVDAASDNTDTVMNQALAAIGGRIRELRQSRNWTLQALASATGLSSGMLSLVERGRASPSIGSLIIISNVLDVTMSDLLAEGKAADEKIVVRYSEAKLIETSQHVIRRVLKEDQTHALSIAINEYEPHTGSSESPISHEGFEYGFVLEGKLSVEVDQAKYLLEPGDLISYSSRRPHRIWNHSAQKVRTLWINLKRD